MKAELSHYPIPGYKIYLEERLHKRSSGVMMYMKEKVSCFVEELNAVSYNALKAEFKICNSQIFTLVLFYRFCGESKLLFVKELES